MVPRLLSLPVEFRSMLGEMLVVSPCVMHDIGV